MHKKALIIIVGVCFFVQTKELSASVGRFFQGASGAFNQARVVAQSFRAPALQGMQSARQLAGEGIQRVQALRQHPNIFQFQSQMRDPEIRDVALDIVVPVGLGIGLWSYLLSLRADMAEQSLVQTQRVIEQEKKQLEQNELLRIQNEQQNEQQILALRQKQREQLLAEEIRSLQKKLVFTTALTALEEEKIRADLSRFMNSSELSPKIRAELIKNLQSYQDFQNKMQRADERAAAEWAQRRENGEPVVLSTFEIEGLCKK